VISYFFQVFDIARLLQPLFERIILLAAVSIGALRVLRVKNTLELFRLRRFRPSSSPRATIGRF
jgi:ribose transport system permease protein